VFGKCPVMKVSNYRSTTRSMLVYLRLMLVIITLFKNSFRDKMLIRKRLKNYSVHSVNMDAAPITYGDRLGWSHHPLPSGAQSSAIDNPRIALEQQMGFLLLVYPW